MKYSFLSLLKQSFREHEDWPRVWNDAPPRDRYDVVIVGAGGHGLATAYYLATEHGIRNIAVVEKGWLGGGNTARNTAIIRSNYLWAESSTLYDHALKLWERMATDLNYNVMFSPRGVVNLAHTEYDLLKVRQRIAANLCNGVDSEFLDIDGLRRICPILNTSRNVLLPVLGASLQRRAGIARHDAVAWGYARAVQKLGVDLVQNCEVTRVLVARGKVTGVETSRGTIRAGKVALVTSAHTSILAETAGVRLPLKSGVLQALVSEPVKPVLNTVVMSNALHLYLNQSDKGELVFGLAPDQYQSYGSSGSFSIIEQSVQSASEYFPTIRRLRMLRQWTGVVDTTPDGSPVIGKSPVDGLFLNCGWGTGGFKATPGSGHVFAHTIACDQPHPIAAPFALDRFVSGRLIDEYGAGAVAH